MNILTSSSVCVGSFFPLLGSGMASMPFSFFKDLAARTGYSETLKHSAIFVLGHESGAKSESEFSPCNESNVFFPSNYIDVHHSF